MLACNVTSMHHVAIVDDDFGELQRPRERIMKGEWTACTVELIWCEDHSTERDDSMPCQLSCKGMLEAVATNADNIAARQKRADVEWPECHRLQWYGRLTHQC